MKNKSAIIFLFIANSISGLAQGITMIAIPWYIANEMNSTSEFGKLYAVVTLISMFWGVYAGSLVDKFNRKNLFKAISIVGGTIMLSIAAYGKINGSLPFLLAVVAFACTYYIYNIHYPTLYAFAQEITEQKHYSRITSWIEVQGQFTSMLSGGLAAMLLDGFVLNGFNLFGKHIDLNLTIPKVDLSTIVMADGITYFVALAFIFLIRYVPIAERYTEHSGVVDRLKIGVQFFKDNSLIFIFGVASTVVFATMLVLIHLILPAYVGKFLNQGAEVFAFSEMIYTVGAIFSGFAIAWLFRKSNSIMAVIILSVIMIGVYFAMSQSKLIWLFYVLSFLIGVSNAGIRIMRITYMFNHIPNQVIGRTNSIFGMINVAMRFVLIGIFALPIFSKDANIVNTFYVYILWIFVAVGVLLWYYKKLINLETNNDSLEFSKNH